MPLHIAQKARYAGDDYWNWSAWIEGDEDELDQIDHVVYILHRTFPNSVRTVSDRTTKFRLKTGGWGAFTLIADVVSKKGTTTRLTHELVLEYPSGTPTTA